MSEAVAAKEEAEKALAVVLVSLGVSGQSASYRLRETEIAAVRLHIATEPCRRGAGAGNRTSQACAASRAASTLLSIQNAVYQHTMFGTPHPACDLSKPPQMSQASISLWRDSCISGMGLCNGLARNPRKVLRGLRRTDK